jgi:hypothetical protein
MKAERRSVLSRTTRSDIHALLQEARAIELLTTEADIAAAGLQDYWDLSADLIALVTDIEDYERQHPDASYQDPSLFALKHRLREITSRLAEMTEETGG